jgi:hypothetical protein
MKNLIPLMALLVLGGSFISPAAMAGGSKKCADGDACCKDGAKKGSKKAKTTAKAASEGDSKPAETK